MERLSMQLKTKISGLIAVQREVPSEERCVMSGDLNEHIGPGQWCEKSAWRESYWSEKPGRRKRIGFCSGIRYGNPEHVCYEK